MGIEGWYLDQRNMTGSSYTDFTIKNKRKSVNHRTVRKARVNNAAGHIRKNKGLAVKKFLCAFGILVVVLGAAAGTWYYFAENNIDVFEAVTKMRSGNRSFDNDKEEKEDHLAKGVFEKPASESDDLCSYSKSDPAYQIAQNVMSSLWCDNDVDTAWEIFNWVHSNISYQPMTTDLSFEDAAYRGFTRKSGDCFVYFACAKMLLDCAGIPNMVVERYPVYTNGHYWNLVQLDGEWYHCDATEFIDHPDLYFMCTDEEIADEHHSFNPALYPERASGYSNYMNNPYYQPGEGIYYDDYYENYGDYYDDGYDDGYGDSYVDGSGDYYGGYYEEDYSDYYEDGYVEYYEDWG